MRLRDVLLRSAAAGAALMLMGHSPYRQWAVFRQSHLIVVAGDDAPGAFALSEAIARTLAEHVSRSRAQVARAKSTVDVMKLLRSRQLPLGVVPRGDAADALQGHGKFAGEDPVPLRALAVLGRYFLVALEDFPAAKAREIAWALAEHLDGAAPGPAAGEPSPVPFHPAVSGAREKRPATAD